MSTDGGSAFPEIRTDMVRERGEYTPDTYSAGGMTLRDYFAAKALSGGMAGAEWDFNGRPMDSKSVTDLVLWSYQIADAMLKAREA